MAAARNIGCSGGTEDRLVENNECRELVMALKRAQNILMIALKSTCRDEQVLNTCEL